MDHLDLSFANNLDDHRGRRCHRFMESSDINTAFRELFEPLRTNIRHGRSNHGQVYAIEMDTCIPGELLGTEWIPPAARGITHAHQLADSARRRALYEQLFSERRPEALLAYVGERRSAPGAAAHLYVEVVSEDAVFAARYAIAPGRGWHKRELLPATHRRVDRVAHS